MRRSTRLSVSTTCSCCPTRRVRAGRPKGVMLSHGNVTWNVVNLLLRRLPGDDVTIAIAPFFRVGGTGVNVLPVLFVGGTVVVPEDVTPDGILGRSNGTGSPSASAIPTFSTRSPARHDGRRWTCRRSASCSPAVPRCRSDSSARTSIEASRSSRATGCRKRGRSLSCSTRRAPSTRSARPADRRCWSTSGSSAPTDATFPGETGELLVRWPQRHGRLLEPAAGDGRGADRRRMAANRRRGARGRGGVRLDRRPDGGPVPVGGRVVYPGDVERVLMAHPAVADAGVVGIPAPDGGEVGAAFVVLAPGRDATEPELIAFSAERLAEHEIPASITFVDTLPRNSVGKLVRDELRTRARTARLRLERASPRSPGGSVGEIAAADTPAGQADDGQHEAGRHPGRVPDADHRLAEVGGERELVDPVRELEGRWRSGRAGTSRPRSAPRSRPRSTPGTGRRSRSRPRRAPPHRGPSRRSRPSA